MAVDVRLSDNLPGPSGPFQSCLPDPFRIRSVLCRPPASAGDVGTTAWWPLESESYKELGVGCSGSPIAAAGRDGMDRYLGDVAGPRFE